MQSDKKELRNKLIELYKRLLLSSKSKENIMNLYVEYIKLMLEYENNLPVYNPFLEQFRSGNCYTYALDIKCPMLFQFLYYFFASNGMNLNVGFIGAVNHRSTISCYTGQDVLDGLYADLDFLKIKVYDSRIDKDPCYGGYKIFIFKDSLIKSTGDFHFVRRNVDGTLSHRIGYDGMVRRLKCLNDVDKKYELIRTLEIVKPKYNN